MDTIKQDAYEKKAEAELKEIEARIILMKAKAERASADAQVRILRRVEELQHKFDHIQERLGRIPETSQEAWAEFQSGFESAVRELREATESAAERILGE